jgi:hypothetical protein
MLTVPLLYCLQLGLRPKDGPGSVSSVRDFGLWHSFSDVLRRVVYVADVASVIMCAVRS